MDISKTERNQRGGSREDISEDPLLKKHNLFVQTYSYRIGAYIEMCNEFLLDEKVITDKQLDELGHYLES